MNQSSSIKLSQAEDYITKDNKSHHFIINNSKMAYIATH